MERRDCCKTWDSNVVIAETQKMRAVYDAFPVREGHALIYPKRHLDRFTDLDEVDSEDLAELIIEVRKATGTNDLTIAINDGELAGRTIPHLHVHVIPRREGDMAYVKGGIRRMFVDPDMDTWTAQRSDRANPSQQLTKEEDDQ